MPPPGAEAVRPLLRRSDLFIEYLGAVFLRRRKKAPRLGARLTPEHDFRYGGPRKYGAHLQYTECMLLPGRATCLPTTLEERVDIASARGRGANSSLEKGGESGGEILFPP